MFTNESDLRDSKEQPKLVLTSEAEEDVKILHENQTQSKKASFFIGDVDSMPTKIVGPDNEEIPIEEIIVAPDGGWGWVIVFASFLSNMVVDGIVFSFGVLVDPITIASNYTIPISAIAWVGSLAAGFYFMAGPVVSAIANRYGFRVVAICGSIVASLGILSAWYLCREGPSMGALLGLYGVVGGIGFGMIYVPAVIAVGFYFETKRALATGIAICGSGIGTMLFPPILDIIIGRFGFQGALLFESVFILVCGLFALLYRPLKPTKVQREGHRKSIASSLASPDGTPLLMRMKKARDMEKWDSVNSFASNEAIQDGQFDTKSKAEKLYNKARKTSTHSLGGSNSALALQHKRMSVPAMLACGDLNSSQQQQQGYLVPGAPQKGKSFVGLPDLKEIAEEDHNSEDGSREHSQAPQADNQAVIKSVMDGNENTNMRNRNNSIFVTKIGNSMLTIDDMTQSRILRVASKVTLNQPLYRDDIFYSGSMLRLPEYANNINKVMTSVEWSAAITNAPTGKGLPEEDIERSCWSSNVLRKMLDVSLLVSPTFLLLSMSGFFTMLGVFVPFLYLKGIASETIEGLDGNLATYLISIIGVANTAGRILSGWVADRPSVNVLIINNISLTIIGLSTALVPLLTSYIQYAIYSCVFGLCMACFASLRSILLVELLGLDKLTNAFGLMMVFQGIASMLGTPLAGTLRESTGSFHIPFMVAGGFLALSGLMCYPLNYVRKWETNRNDRKKRKSIKV